MRILISGSSGLIGSVLCRHWEHQNFEIVRLSRDAGINENGVIPWSPREGVPNLEALEGFDAVVHLAGANIASKRWTTARKRILIGSRVPATLKLAEQIATCVSPPKVFISASAVGFYGDRGEEVLEESSSPGEGFLAALCQDWEAAATPAQSVARVVNLRTGVVLSRFGGALAKMLPVFRLGLGGRIGSGKQYMSYISMLDMCNAIDHIIKTPTLSGPVNLCAPKAVTNSDFTKTLGKILHRPTVFPVPAMALKLGLGEMAQEALLASTRVKPTWLLKSGFKFSQPGLEEALELALQKK